MYTGTRYDENPEVPEGISEDNGGEWQGEFKERHIQERGQAIDTQPSMASRDDRLNHLVR